VDVTSQRSSHARRNPFDAASLVTSAEVAAGFWQMGILWTPLIPGESTHGTYDLATQRMSTQHDLLGEYRDHDAAHPDMP
jgi:hypothetical protein